MNLNSMYCDKCNYPLLVIFEKDYSYCPRCAGILQFQMRDHINWKSRTDEQVIEIWRVVALNAPNMLWEVEMELYSRRNIRQLADAERDYSPTPRITARFPQLLRRILPLISEQARKSGGVVHYVTETEAPKGKR